MPRRSKPKPAAKDVQGLKYLKVLQPLLQSLHEVGTQRDTAGNRQLHMDHYCMLILMWMFSPTLTSLRGIQQASTLQKVQRKFKIPRAALGTLSEAPTVFDPEKLKHIAQELGQQIPKIARAEADNPLAKIDKTLTAVDGSVVKLLTQIAELAWIKIDDKPATCGYRLHTQFEVLRGLPHRIDATSANPKGDNDERAVLERTLEPERFYVMDRGYIKRRLFNSIVEVGSSYACRMRDKVKYTARQTRTLTKAAEQAGVLADELIELPVSKGSIAVTHPVRLVSVRCSPHSSRGHYRAGKYSSTAPSSDGVLRILTNELELPAELIAQMYQYRWTIEIFFRMIKQMLGCRHLLSTKPNGVAIQIYSAIIACMLIMLYTGHQPKKRTFEMVCFYIVGWATLEELEAHIKKLR